MLNRGWEEQILDVPSIDFLESDKRNADRAGLGGFLFLVLKKLGR
jgi:hypothetical protein